MRQFIFWVLTAGFLSPIAAFADTYDALCNENDCKITINKSGFSVPQGFIATDQINQWYTGGDE